MAIFGNMYSSTGELVHAQTQYDIFANYVFGLICICFFLISSASNPIVFFHHRRGKQSLTAILFQLLTVNDFLTCLIGIPPLLYYLIHQDLDHVSHTVKPWQIFFSVLRYSLFRWSICIGAALGVVRAIGILKPFAIVKPYIVLGSLLLASFATTATALWRVLADPLSWNLYAQQVLQLDLETLSPAAVVALVIFTATVITAVSSAVSSLYGLHKSHVRREKEGLEPGHECPACKTVMFLNFLIFTQFLITVVTLAVTWISPDQVVLIHYLEFLMFPVSNCGMSALNPLIILLRSGELKKLLSHAFLVSRKGSEKDKTAISSV